MRALLTLAVASAALTLATAVSGDDRHASFVVIVHPANAANALDRHFLADAFLKKVTTWPDGGVIHPVDLHAASPVRREFTEDVLHRSIQEVKGYWQQRIFAGRDVPPPELEGDEAVVEYVLKHDGAVGYVSRSAPIGGAKSIAIQ